LQDTTLGKAIGTANYDDEILRTLGFIKQLELQTSKGLFVTSGNHGGIKLFTLEKF